MSVPTPTLTAPAAGPPADGGAPSRSGPLLLGVRHHGPGSARSVRAALEHERPKAVLIEGPPEADGLVELAADAGMRPPVALLAHAADDPARAAFWPFAEFSPEWVALRWAVEHGVPVRFIDLPAAHTLAMGDDRLAPVPVDAGADEDEEAVRVDPIGALAEAAGYDDPERWWEDAVEHRLGGARRAAGVAVAAPEPAADPSAVFEALAEAMGALRETYGDGGHDRDPVREAHMRLRLREARREFGDRVAVVCGAWHVPALAARTTVTADRQLLKGLPKVKTEITWVPWTHRRLSRTSGYGAGISSPGWYGHLYGVPDRPIERWMTRVAGLLRDEDHPVSPAHVIEAVRLADTLAVMRGRPLAGLVETTDAVRAVMCDGSDVPLALVRDRLVVGDDLGEVPESAPAVPLQRDLTRTQRGLRLKPEALEREVELDLRKDTDAARSRLLHRLTVLGIAWGAQTQSRGGTGTFRETWRLRWEPELSVRVAEAGGWGTTVLSAATGKAQSDAVGAENLADITALAELCLLAGLPDALPTVMRALADRAALDTDVGHLARALPALVRSVRYGDVRGTDASAPAEVALGLAERIFVGLPPACVALDADGAAEMRRHLDAVHSAVGLLAQSGTLTGPETEGAPAADPPDASDPDAAAAGASGADTEAGAGASAAGVPRADGLRERWTRVLRSLADRDTVSGLIRGRAVRLLLDEQRVTEEDVARLMGLALSPGTPPVDAAAWVEGFVGGGAGGGMLLVHDTRLLALLDGWLASVPADAFTDVLPLLRRTFEAYDPGVRRTLGELVRRGPATSPGSAAEGEDAPAPGFGPGLDRERAEAVLPTLRLLLGLDRHDDAGAGT